MDKVDATRLVRIIISKDGGVTNAKVYTTTSALTDGTVYIVEMHHNCSSDVSDIVFNGSSQAVTKAVDGTVDAIHNSTAKIRLGALSAAGSAAEEWSGDIAAAIFGDAALGASRKADFRNYLNNRYQVY
jgi:hypothetical protein